MKHDQQWVIDPIPYKLKRPWSVQNSRKGEGFISEKYQFLTAMEIKDSPQCSFCKQKNREVSSSF